MSKNGLSPTQLANLRSEGTITATELAYIMGDLLIVEEVKTGEKRVIENHYLLREGTRQILKG